MNTTRIAALLSQARKNLQWTQTTLAEQTDIPRARISQFENAHRRPSESEWHKLQRVLNLPYFSTSQPAQLPRPRRSWNVAKPTLDEPERPVAPRMFAARRTFGIKAVNTALAKVSARSDQQFCHQFLRQARLESGHELLFWLKLLANGANPYRISPLRAGFRKLSVVQPNSKDVFGDVRVPCLDNQGDGYRCLLFPQVTVDTRKAYFRLDALAYMRSARDRRWLNIEIDGQGHDAQFDRERQQLLGLATVRLNTQELAADNLAVVLDRKLAPLLGLELAA